MSERSALRAFVAGAASALPGCLVAALAAAGA